MLAELERSGLVSYFGQAFTALRESTEFDRAAATASGDALDHRRAIARAVIAHASIAAVEADYPLIDGGIRDSITKRLTDELNGYGLGVADFFLESFKGLAKHMATRKLTGDRGALTDSAAPFAGDVLRFLARGDEARVFLHDAIDDAGDDVFLLGHSLGGVMCVDLLAKFNIPTIRGIITVGSQAPFLYEIGALPSLEHPDPLPRHFPQWLNVYDRRDPLSYLAASIFGQRVIDVEVDNGQPLMESHSAYWSNTKLWAAVAEFIR
jgi:hypothetical protein